MSSESSPNRSRISNFSSNIKNAACLSKTLLTPIYDAVRSGEVRPARHSETGASVTCGHISHLPQAIDGGFAEDGGLADRGIFVAMAGFEIFALHGLPSLIISAAWTMILLASVPRTAGRLIFVPTITHC